MIRSLSLRVLKALHKVYKVCLSPFIGQQCRFYPTCSDYAVQAIEKHGFLKGSYLAAIRVIKCNPCHKGGDDPVPD